ncbi:MAG: amino acid-binding protein [Coriobacteriia bacterium]|nr:amino acid-binding protein [Coriobacteriia bacterium]
MISQLTVFLGNEEGRLAAAVRTLSQADINLHSLNIAESADFGILRIICDTPEAALEAMKTAGYQASLTPLVAVQVPNVKGGLASLLNALDEKDINIEYGYCFSLNEQTAIDVLKIKQEGVEAELAQAGFTIVAPADIYVVD